MNKIKLRFKSSSNLLQQIRQFLRRWLAATKVVIDEIFLFFFPITVWSLFVPYLPYLFPPSLQAWTPQHSYG